MSSHHEAYYRHAAHYYHVLHTAAELFGNDDSANQGLDQFELEWANINAGQS